MTTSLTSIEAAKAYLDEQSIPYESVKELSGGFANWVFLVTQPDGGPGIILKHTSGVVKAFPTIEAPPDRSAYEARALRAIPPAILDPGVDVHLPELLLYNEEAHTQHQRPAGTRTLKDAYTDETLDVVAIGKRMGRWIAALHAIPTPVAGFEDNAPSRHLAGECYRGCPAVLENWGLDPTPARVAVEKYEPLFRTENRTVCHGDFWAGNVLLQDMAESSPKITMVDWEMSRMGYGATDIGQFAAESWLLDKFRGGRGLLPAFLDAYADAKADTKEVTVEFVKRAVVHCGIHLAYWPSMVSWSDTEGTKGILAYGADLISNAEREDIEWLKSSIFGPLMKHIDA